MGFRNRPLHQGSADSQLAPTRRQRMARGTRNSMRFYSEKKREVDAPGDLLHAAAAIS